MPDVQYPDESGSNPSTIRIEDLLANDERVPSTDTPVREGLPRSFRMRADKHYVEMLDAPQPSSEPPTTARAAVTMEHDLPAVDVEALAVAATSGRELATALAALRASTNLLSDRGQALASSVAGNLIRAEVWRATCLLHTSRFLRGEISAAPKSVHAQMLIEQTLKVLEPERRLRGVDVDVQVSLGDCRIEVDEELMVSALSGVLMATIALQQEQSPFAVSLIAASRGSDVVIEVAQESVGAPAAWATDTPAIVFARRLVSVSDGRTTVFAAGGGTGVQLTLPRLH